MNCDDLLKELNAYVDGTLEPSLCTQLQEHLKGCNPCQVVVDNIRGTIRLYKAGQPYELPPELRARLHAKLKTKWRERFGEQGL